MSSRPSFERYPGPPSGHAAAYRIISPQRDALAWISISGKLSLARLLIRDGEEWSTLVEEHAPENGDGRRLWGFSYRDPVELVFTTTPESGIEATASVTVGTDGCEVRVRPELSSHELHALIAGADDLLRVVSA